VTYILLVDTDYTVDDDATDAVTMTTHPTVLSPASAARPLCSRTVRVTPGPRLLIAAFNILNSGQCMTRMTVTTCAPSRNVSNGPTD